MPAIIEIKARCSNLDKARAVLSAAGARRIGLDESKMRATCEEWMRRLKVRPEHLIAHSYIDMLEALS